LSSVVRDSYRQWVKDHRFDGLNVTLTSKQNVGGVKIDHLTLQRNVRYFKNILNRKVFGNSYFRYGKELKTLFIQENSEDVRYHIHGIIEHPTRFNLEEFEDVIRCSWGKTIFGYDQIHIEDPSNQLRKEGWMNYIMKSKTKSEFSSSIDLENSSCFYLC
jgi:hypothetical protein